MDGRAGGGAAAPRPPPPGVGLSVRAAGTLSQTDSGGVWAGPRCVCLLETRVAGSWAQDTFRAEAQLWVLPAWSGVEAPGWLGKERSPPRLCRETRPASLPQ